MVLRPEFLPLVYGWHTRAIARGLGGVITMNTGALPGVNLRYSEFVHFKFWRRIFVCYSRIPRRMGLCSLFSSVLLPDEADPTLSNPHPLLRGLL